MTTRKRSTRMIFLIPAVVLAFIAIGLITGLPRAATDPGAAQLAIDPPVVQAAGTPEGGAAPDAPCAGGPVIDGVTLDECFIETFMVGGASKSIRVWYTNNPITATRIVDGNPVTLMHWIDTDAQAQQVAAWGREAWQRYWEIFGHHPYDTGCGDRINVQMEDGIGWSGIAYWASSGSCRIGIDSPTIRGGGGQWTVYHEFQHYLQYSYDSGCYAFLQANYDSGSAAGDAEFVEGYADLGADAVDATLDAVGYGGNIYNPVTSMYDKSYGNIFNKYFIEQLGVLWTPADPHHHMDALAHHYEACDVADTLYVMNTLIPSLKPGVSEEQFFVNFFAANWAKNWANATTQPELVYTDDNGNPYGAVPLAQDVTLSGPQSWNGETTPDDWAGKYYQVKPQASCAYVSAKVDGAAGAHLGINLMAADTFGSTSVLRSAWIGEDFARTFAGFGVYDRIVASVNAFATSYTYDVSFDCVTPALDILEPRQTNFAMVGEPASPIAFLSRFKVTSGGAPVRGLLASSFSANAEGDPITFVNGSFQEVGEEYWAIMLPPTKTVGTTFVDLTICLDGALCDTENNALLYVNPGNTDFALVFDGSGSMATEDIVGEGTRLVNAQKAGTVMADLLRTGDRILVTSFSGIDNPPGCGLPGGDGNCPLDIQTHLPRTDVVTPGTIAVVKTAINAVTARAWTPIAAGLVDAKNQLLAGPANTNPKHIVLLSDGEENVNPLYATVQAELIASGVVIDTVGFSGESPAALLAQIAADTGGTFTFVPTTGGTRAPVSQDQINTLLSMGLPPQFVDRVTAELLPGPLGLDNVYDYLDTKNQGAARLFHTNNISVPDGEWRYASQYVDDSVNVLRLVTASKQEDYEGCSFSIRNVEVLPPGADPQQGWIPISPPRNPPANWDIRNSVFDDVLIVTAPDPGVWQMRTMHTFCIPRSGDAPAAGPYDVMMNGSAETNIVLQGRFLFPIVNNQGMAGDIVPIVGVLLDRTGAIPGAGMLAIIEKPGTTDFLFLFDDGLNADVQAGDGIYTNLYSLTNVGGSYNVRLFAFWQDASLNFLTREWYGGFWINGPDANDLDQDGMPDPWELRCKLDTTRDDALEDPDRDGLNSLQEFQYGTLPCRADTDRGGERDGSEVLGGRNPLWPRDDLVSPIGHFTIQGLNQLLLIRWTPPVTYTTMILYLSTDPDALGLGTDIGNSGQFTMTGVVNDQTYYAVLAPAFDNAMGDYTEQVAVTPKEDPDPPSGAMLINDGAPTTASAFVTLDISSSDTPLPGAAESANAHLGGLLALKYNTISGGVEMRISNDPGFEGAVWEPLAMQKSWVLGGAPGQIYRVYIQFRDAAGNESFIVYDDIFYAPKIYLPIVIR